MPVEQVVDHTPAWLAFTGAIIVASIAALTAQWRQRVEMRHDRDLHDLGELRSLLDDCAVVVAQASGALLSFANLLVHTTRGTAAGGADERRKIVTSDDNTLEISGPFADIDEVGEQVLKEAEPLFALYQRVLLRLGQNHSVTLALRDVHGLFATPLIRATGIDGIPLESPARVAAVEKWQGEVREVHFTFLAACHHLVRSKIADDRVSWWSGRFALGTARGTERRAPEPTESRGTDREPRS